MRKFFNISTIDILLSAILIALPVSIKATNYILILLVVVLIIDSKGRLNGPIRESGQGKLLLINILPFIFICISLSYSEAFHQGLKGVEKYLPLLIFPVVFYIAQTRKSNQFFLRLFAFIVLTMTVVCTIYALYNFIFVTAEDQVAVGDNYSMIISKWNALSNTSLMQPFSINPIYMSLYVSFALFILILDNGLKSVLKISLVAVLLIFQLLISSRIGIGALLLSSVVFAVLFKYKLKPYFRAISLSLIAAVICSFLLIFYNPILQKRFVNDLDQFELPSDVSGWNGINIRHAIWKCSVQLFSKSPVAGYGAGSQYSVRESCYRNYSFYGPFGEMLNCHNQYLEYSLIGGILLVSLFLFQLYSNIRFAFANNAPLRMIFLVLFMITCLGESLLETHKGIVFFSYFNSLFLFCRNK